MLERIKPISYLKAHASEIVRKVAEDRSTVIITQNGNLWLFIVYLRYSFDIFYLYLVILFNKRENIF